MPTHDYDQYCDDPTSQHFFGYVILEVTYDCQPGQVCPHCGDPSLWKQWEVVKPQTIKVNPLCVSAHCLQSNGSIGFHPNRGTVSIRTVQEIPTTPKVTFSDGTHGPYEGCLKRKS